MVACIPIQKQSETQLYRVSTPKTLHQKRWVSLSLYWLWRIKKSYVFLLFSGFLVVSVQPNLPEDTVLSKIDTYGLCSKHTYWKEKLQKSLKKMVHLKKCILHDDIYLLSTRNSIYMFTDDMFGA